MIVLYTSSGCQLPYISYGCRIENVYYSENQLYKEFVTDREILCDVNEEFEFIFEGPTPSLNKSDEKCFLYSFSVDDADDSLIYQTKITFKWMSSNILEERFNFTNVIRYFSYFFEPRVYLNLWGIKGFDVNFLGRNYNNTWENSSIFTIALSDCRLSFYHNKRKINSCQDFIDFNITQIASIFQIAFYEYDYTKEIELKNIEYKGTICPLVFQNGKFIHLTLIDLADSFYKKNVLTFPNETYPHLNSSIKGIELHNCYNIKIDSKMLHQSVFYNLRSLSIVTGSLKSISGNVFKNFNHFYILMMNPRIFRKINHKQGIEWIRQMNFGLNVNFSKEPSDEDHKHFSRTKVIQFTRTVFNKYKDTSPYKVLLPELLPDEDFCLYADFPFNQLVIVIESYNDMLRGTRNVEFLEVTCTYLWLVQYYEYYEKYLSFDNNGEDIDKSIKFIRSQFNATTFECDFEERISSCNKSNYQRKDIWDESDFFMLNKKAQTVFKISLYPVSLLGLITNFIVVLVILKKDNSDLFKQCKQYNYLYLNSIFCMLISLIELLSWMTECFYPFEVFCPEIRKLIAIQFFKIIFTECFVTLFRFMCNFTYIAFALNRIGLIGKDHGKVVTFISEVGIKKYIGVTLFISLLFSWMKYFQYQINYYNPNFDFPMFNQVTMDHHISNKFKDVLFIFNVISDLVNYLVFVIVTIIIDICMVVQLRQVLGEKLKKSESMNQKQNESKKTESEEAVNKAIKMVVLNSAIGILFKLPVCFIPLLNVYAQFYFKKYAHVFDESNFKAFFQYLYESGYYDLIQDMSHFLLALSFSIQIFIYYRFDKKFLTGYQRIMKKAYITSNSKSS